MTAALPVVRGPVALAKSLAAIDLLSGRPARRRARPRLVGSATTSWSGSRSRSAGPGSTRRWPRCGRSSRSALWVASWGSPAGLRRVARYGDGWLASAYNTTPERFAAAREQLPDGLPERARDDVDLGTAMRRRPSACCARCSRRCSAATRTSCATASASARRSTAPELLARYAEAGCERVYLWPLGDEPRQLERIAPLAARCPAQALDHRGDRRAVVRVARTGGADPPHRRARGERAHLEAGQRMGDGEARDDRDAEPGRDERLHRDVVVGGEGRPAA